MVKQSLEVGACESGLHLLCVKLCLFDRPLRQESGVDHEVGTVTMMERLLSEPGEQFTAIFCRQDILNGVFRSQRDDAFSHGEQKQVVVPQYRSCCWTETFDVAQDVERAGASINQVADKPEAVYGRIKSDKVE